MTSVSFDKNEYKAGETATITYADAPSGALIQIITPTRRVARSWPVSGSGSVEWAISADPEIGRHSLHLYDNRGSAIAHDTATINGGAPPTEPPPTEPPPTGFTDTGNVTPSKIEVSPATYDVMFKLAGYKDKIISTVVVSEGATKIVSATLELEVAPPVGMTKSEFIAEIQSRGEIDLSKVSISRVLNNWFKVADSIRFEDQNHIIILLHIDLRNPPSRVEDIIFYDSNYSDLTSIDRAKGLAIINKLPFVGVAPPTKKTVTFMSVPSGASVNIATI